MGKKARRVGQHVLSGEDRRAAELRDLLLRHQAAKNYLGLCRELREALEELLAVDRERARAARELPANALVDEFVDLGILASCAESRERERGAILHLAETLVRLVSAWPGVPDNESLVETATPEQIAALEAHEFGEGQGGE